MMHRREHGAAIVDQPLVVAFLALSAVALFVNGFRTPATARSSEVGGVLLSVR